MEMPLLANKAPFDNALVRQAMEYAIPYDQIIQNVFHGLAIRKSPGFLRSDAPGYDGSGFTDFSYDPAKAKALLAQAGVSAPVSYTLTVSAAEPDMQEAAVQIQTYAKAAGFNIAIKQVPAAAFGQGRTDHTFQAFLLLDYSITLTPSYELNVYTAKNPDGSPAGNNLGAWVDPAFYTAKAKADALADPYTPAAGQLWNATERIFIDQAPIAFIAQIQPTTAFRTDVQGITWRSDQWIDWSQASKGASAG
jgi:peptide/nickel transport system substrate-binding protein